MARLINFYIMIAVLGNSLSAQPMTFPENHWQQYLSPEDAGFSTQKLEAVKAIFEQSGGAALFIAHRGKVLAAWGHCNRRFRQASIRKSYLSALMGIYAHKGQVNLNSTMGELGIDDLQPLSEVEKQARVIDLLASRSGIYLPAAYTTEGNKADMPERGSHAPGTHWYYNNWDFNTLVTIFNRQTGRDFFEAFREHIAGPLQMEDFSLAHTYYRYEEDVSRHPAYLFRMSARDMARFGLLYLNEGRWKEQQIIPETWVKQSTAVCTKTLGPRFESRGSYGLLWWIYDDIAGQPMYYASGAGGQRIFILPEADIVFVHLTDTYQMANHTQHEDILEMIRLLLEAKVGEPVANPELSTYQPSAREIETQEPEPGLFPKIAGTYQNRFLGAFTIEPQKDDQLLMTTGIGRYTLYPIGPRSFFVGDMEIVCEFQRGDAEQQWTVVAQMDEKRKVEKVVFYYE